MRDKIKKVVQEIEEVNLSCLFDYLPRVEWTYTIYFLVSSEGQ